MRESKMKKAKEWDEQTVHDLRAARKRIEAGWGQGSFGEVRQATGPVCAIGGVMYATNQRKGWRRNMRYLRACLLLANKGNYGGNRVSDVIRNNDNSWTSKGDVLRMFDRAIRYGEIELKRRRMEADLKLRRSGWEPVIALDDSEFRLIELPKPVEPEPVEQPADEREPVGASA